MDPAVVCALLAWVGLAADWWFARTLRRLFATDERFQLGTAEVARITLPVAQLQAIAEEAGSGAASKARGKPKWWNRDAPLWVYIVVAVVLFVMKNSGAEEVPFRILGAAMFVIPIFQLMDITGAHDVLQWTARRGAQQEE